MTVASGGKVGIASTSPTEKLEVDGVLRSQITNQQGLIALGNALNGSGYYDNGMYRGGVGTRADNNYLNLGSYQGIVFTASNAALGNQSVRMYIDGGTGYAGIGQTAPNGRLDISNNGGSDGIVLTQQVDNTESIQTYIDGHWGDRTTYASGCCNTLALQPDVGVVGIRTLSPGYTLDVNATIFFFIYF